MAEKTLQDKVVLITGATGGLGTAVTTAFQEAGARIAAVDRAPHAPSDERFLSLAADLSTFEGARVAAETVVKKWGSIDVLVHLVGGFAGGQSIAESDDALFDRMMNINVRTTFYMFRATVPHMRAQGSGRILAIGSRAAVEPSPKIGLYGASKAAMVSLVRTLASENADRGITANVILPSTIDTPINRAAMPSANFSQWVPTNQIASMLVHLAGDDASAVNGAVIPIYGGA
jgi:NAD(P)-dependent dehydrogenase (short-subunit alcohol dehydrogenase family)